MKKNAQATIKIPFSCSPLDFCLCTNLVPRSAFVIRSVALFLKRGRDKRRNLIWLSW